MHVHIHNDVHVHVRTDVPTHVLLWTIYVIMVFQVCMYIHVLGSTAFGCRFNVKVVSKEEEDCVL